MEKSSSSDSSSRRWRNRVKGRVTGIPKSCWCGAETVEKISRSEDNPYRRYFRCCFTYSQKLQDDPHVFKWVDEAFQNEISQLEYQVSLLEEEVLSLKVGGNQTSSSQTVDTPAYVTADALNEFETSLLRNVDEVMDEAVGKMNKMMALVFGACVTVVVLAVTLKK